MCIRDRFRTVDVVVSCAPPEFSNAKQYVLRFHLSYVDPTQRGPGEEPQRLDESSRDDLMATKRRLDEAERATTTEKLLQLSQQCAQLHVKRLATPRYEAPPSTFSRRDQDEIASLKAEIAALNGALKSHILSQSNQPSKVPRGYAAAVSEALAARGLGGLLWSGLPAKLLCNGISSIVFSVAWKGLMERYKKATPPKRDDGEDVESDAEARAHRLHEEEAQLHHVPHAYPASLFQKWWNFPGTFPYTRGIHPTGYRGKMWTMRQYAGFSSVNESNKRYLKLIESGVSGLSIAFDLPTQIAVSYTHLTLPTKA